MPRSTLQDELQIFRFWLLDMSVLDSLSAPVLNPLSGFSSITAPEITAEIIDIPEGNWIFKRKIIGRAGASPITLTRGAKVWDHDFYDWIIHTISGESLGAAGDGGIIQNTLNTFGNFSNSTPRKNLLLIQFFPRNPFEDATTAALAMAGKLVDFTTGLVTAPANAITNGIASNISFGPPGLVTLIPARAWMLYGCVPSRYKVSQDFNARSGEVSLMELTLEVEEVEELTL